MKRIYIPVTSILNIILHFIAFAGLSFFAYRGFEIREGNVNEAYGSGVWSGLMGSLAVLILVDMIGCIFKRIKEKRVNRE